MKNYLIGIVFLLAAFYLLWQQGEVAREQSTVDTAWDENKSLPSNQAFQPTEEKKQEPNSENPPSFLSHDRVFYTILIHTVKR